MKTTLSKPKTRKPVRSIILLFSFILCFQAAFSATFTVTSNADAGATTLRQAIINANAAGGADVINFNFGTATTITLASCLPPITEQITIDGYSDPAASAGNLMIQVIFPSGCKGFELASGSDGSTIRGIVINAGATGVFGINLHNSNN